MNTVINKHQNIILSLQTILVLTGYLISKNMLFEDYHFQKYTKVYEQGYTNLPFKEQSIPLVLAGRI
jgi:hypothetical protein